MSPGSLDRVWYTSSGSEAIEAALKLARQYHLERGDPERSRVIARRLSYHGNTLGALGRRRQRVAARALRAAADRRRRWSIPASNIACAEPGESAEDYGRRAADSLEQAIERLGPETVMAFVAETVVGATAGAVPPVPGYLQRIREICDRYGVLLILDEVMCGSGRTGTFLSCEQDGVVPDIVDARERAGRRLSADRRGRVHERRL